VFIVFTFALVSGIPNKSFFLNTLQGIRTCVAKQSGKGMKKGLSLLVENNSFFADSKAIFVSFKIKRVSADTL
jgi:hypothetical protein